MRLEFAAFGDMKSTGAVTKQNTSQAETGFHFGRRTFPHRAAESHCNNNFGWTGKTWRLGNLGA